MLNVLYVMFHDFTAQSAVQVSHAANEVAAQGASCMVAVPDNPQSIVELGRVRFSGCSFDEIRNGKVFPDGRGPDVVHTWTPREVIRRFCQRLREKYSFRLFIHMEDNERHLLATALKRPWKEIAAMSRAELDRTIPLHLSHPVLSQEFLQSADGATVIIDSLREFIPRDLPAMELWPAADGSLFVQGPINNKVRSRLRIPRDRMVLAYMGNVHPANAAEMRSLYLAVAILNREGHPATLIRTGKDFCSFLGPDERWARQHAIELGFVPRGDLPGLVSAADILVQPGKPDAFNDYRFPCKIPEFMAAGRPVILPACNIALQMVHGRDAFVIPKCDALGIVDAVLTVTRDGDLYSQLSRGARAFFDKYLNAGISARPLLSFYQGAALRHREAIGSCAGRS